MELGRSYVNKCVPSYVPLYVWLNYMAFISKSIPCQNILYLWDYRVCRYPAGVFPTFKYPTFCLHMVYTRPVWPKSCIPSAFFFVTSKRCSHTILKLHGAQERWPSVVSRITLCSFLHLIGAYLFSLSNFAREPSSLYRKYYFTNISSVSAAFLFWSVAEHLFTYSLVHSLWTPSERRSSHSYALSFASTHAWIFLLKSASNVLLPAGVFSLW